MRSFFIAAYSLIAGIFICSSMVAQVAAIKFIVTVPEFSFQKGGKVYLVGSFNGWKPNDSLYIMNRENENSYSLLVPLFDGKEYQYKYTLGGWSTVEINRNDSDRSNRQLYSRNGIILYDTVLKWKVLPPSQTKTSSPQMQKIIAIKDSAAVQLQSMLNRLLVLLKQYNENMLSPKPKGRLHKKQIKETIAIIAKMYGSVESSIWEFGMSLTPEQKQKILAAIQKPGGSNDVLNTIKNAYGENLK